MTAYIRDEASKGREQAMNHAAEPDAWEADALKRVAEISAMFEGATGWGSWMVSAANERERLVARLNATGRHAIEQKWRARTGGGGRVS